MAGLYIHVPFCKTRCIYCDFYTNTNLEQKTTFVSALCDEIKLRANYIERETIQTIYFGGGTPSQLSKEDFKLIFDSILSEFTIDTDPEITLEANPDDLDKEYLEMLFQLGFNRLSIGIQSFNDKQLLFLNRRHSAAKAINVVKTSQKIGFSNISIDLMYGLPNLNMLIWEDTLNTAIGLGIQHISSYHLIYEEGTKLYKLLQNNRVKSIDEELSLEMFSMMINKLNNAGFIHYEISNFGKENYFSRHNTSYWLGKKYLGLGPSAHSFNGKNRCWNISSTTKYIQGVEAQNLNIEIEHLDKNILYNEYILTGMRTMWGINIEKLRTQFGIEMLSYCEKNLAKHLSNNDVIYDDKCYRLSKKGIFISDSIMSDLMYVE